VKFKKAVIAVRLSYGKKCASRKSNEKITARMLFESPFIVFEYKFEDGEWKRGGLTMDLVDADDWRLEEL